MRMLFFLLFLSALLLEIRSRRGRDCMVDEFTTACLISVYHHLTFEFESFPSQDVLDTTLCDKVCQWPATGWWYISAVIPVSSSNKADRHDIAEILLKVAINIITLIHRRELILYYVIIYKHQHISLFSFFCVHIIYFRNRITSLKNT
jgi:hypothetical protein